MRQLFTFTVILLGFTADMVDAQEVITIEPDMRHIRQSGDREWAEFPEQSEQAEFRGHFFLDKTFQTSTAIALEQQDVKQFWEVSLNGAKLGRLHRDENAMRVYFEIAPAQLTRGLNELRIATKSEKTDDILVGRVEFYDRPVEEILNQRKLRVQVTEAGEHVPCRITVLDKSGALQQTGLSSSEALAVRPGVIYSSTGKLEIGLPPGDYTVIAGRGPEYSISRAHVDFKGSPQREVSLAINRVVDTSDWIACDTHVHTLTHSGHGDSTEDERIISLAGEGVEFPVITEHNKQINYSRRQSELGLEQAYTLVTGNEVTTRWGHFNIWPVDAEGAVPKFKGNDWETIFSDISAAVPEVIILNHAEDIHSGYTPFGRENRHRLTGHHLDGWELEANAMEVVNSGAQQTDIMQLPLDWMVCLNRGQMITPVGCSDSHDVARHFVGQGRTYIRCSDSKPGEIDVAEAVNSFQAGRVIVSCGLIPMVEVEGKYGPGDLVPKLEGQTLSITLNVTSPEWASFDRYVVYVNGQPLPAVTIPDAGNQYQQVIEFPAPKHDVHIEVAVFGPGVRSLHWPIAKPYQPDSSNWDCLNFGLTGAIWYDGNGDGKRNSARDIALAIWKNSEDDVSSAVRALSQYDRAVSLQLAEIVHQKGTSPQSADMREFLSQQPDFVKQAFADYWDEWRQSEIARVSRQE